ncbi:MAG TPA: DUF3618 domain-containing protein [Allosphingosinicella sp.]
MTADLTRARLEADAARTRFFATASELQERLRPGNLASNAWEGVKDKSGELADDAMQAAKSRPVAVSAVLAAFTLFLARAPIKSAVTSLISGGNDEDPEPAEVPRVEPQKPARRRRTRKNEE